MTRTTLQTRPCAAGMALVIYIREREMNWSPNPLEEVKHSKKSRNNYAPWFGSGKPIVYNGFNLIPGGNLGREENLIRQIAQGDLNALEQLSRIYQNRLYVYLLRLLGNGETAEEVMNDVIHGVWRGAANFKGESRPSTWIFSIAHKKAITRRTKQQLATVDLDVAQTQADSRATPEKDLIQKDLIKRAMGHLSQEHREVVELTFYSGFSYQEISEIVDCPVNTVKTRMYHARQQLRKIIAKEQKVGE